MSEQDPSVVWPDLSTNSVYPTQDSSEPLRCTECGELIRLDGRPFSWDGVTARHEEPTPAPPERRTALDRLYRLHDMISGDYLSILDRWLGPGVRWVARRLPDQRKGPL